jgi:hypothetical protein
MPDSNLIRQELYKLSHLPPWGRQQGDAWDRLSNFIYRVQTLAGVRRQAQAVARANRLDVEPFVDYTIRRWYNHHTHDQILKIFFAHPDVRPEANPKNRQIDFYLRNIPFDLKVSRFPRAYPETITYARKNPHHLAEWQYLHQSKQGRYHLGNRLFIVLHNSVQPEQSWRLRREFEMLGALVTEFLNRPILLGLAVTDQHTQEQHRPWTAIVFHVKPGE